jgi:hypothetical protein
MAMRLGIVGYGYASNVLVPAFRTDPRVDIVAIAGRNPVRVEAAARENGIKTWLSDWQSMLDRNLIDAVAIAVPPFAQEDIAQLALERGVHVFAEKPLTVSVGRAKKLAHAASISSRAHVVDFNFRGIAAFGVAQDMLRSGAIGAIRHVAVNWQVESYANRARLENWKTDQASGGGALFNFVSHSLDYLEGFAGTIRGLSARLAGIPGDTRKNDSFVAMAFDFTSGAAGSLVMSAAAYRGSGHRIDIYGENGAIVLLNSSTDYMRGFKLLFATRPGDFVEIRIPSNEIDNWQDGRVLPVSRLVHCFLDWAEGGTPAEMDFAAGLRVQQLLDVARLSHATGNWIRCSPGDWSPDC